jgi:hypothetical protein
MIQITELIAAFEHQERATLAAKAAERKKLSDEASARESRRKAALDAILSDFAEPLARLCASRQRDAGMARHTSGPDYIRYWSNWDHSMLLILYVSDTPEGTMRYSAWDGPASTSRRYCETVNHDPALVTTCPTELKVWLAQFLGKRLARL